MDFVHKTKTGVRWTNYWRLLIAEPARERVSGAPLLRKFGNLSSQEIRGSDVIVMWPFVRPHHRVTNTLHTLDITLCWIPCVFGAKSHVDPRCSKTSKDNKSQKQICQWKKKVQKNAQLSFRWKGKSSISAKKIRRRSSGEKCKCASSVLFELGRNTAWVRSFSQRPSTPNIAELVLFGFVFCPQPWFLRRSEHILPGKNTSILMLLGSLSRRKK